MGISGGHSRSIAVCADADFRLLGAVEGKSLNQHMLGEAEVSVHLRELLDSLARRLPLPRDMLAKQTRFATLSIAGAATEEDRALMEICLIRAGWPRGGKNYEIVDDTWAGLLAGTLVYRGTCAIAGTGASVYVASPNSVHGNTLSGKPAKIDGWGPIIGDFGSGFELASEFFRFLGRYYDKEQSAPALFSYVVDIEPLITTIANCQQWFDTIFLLQPNDWRVRFARLAAAVTIAADARAPDADARALVLASADRMIESISIALNRWPDAKKYPVVLQGGMFEYSTLYRRRVVDAVRDFTSSAVGLSKWKATMGALLMAAFPERNEPSKAVVEQLSASIQLLPKSEQRLLVADPEDQAYMLL